MVFSLAESPSASDIYSRSQIRPRNLKFSPEYSPRHVATQSGGIPEIPAYLARSFDRYLTCRISYVGIAQPSLRDHHSHFNVTRWFAQLKSRLRSEPNGNWDGVIKQRWRIARIMVKTASPNAPVIHHRNVRRTLKISLSHLLSNEFPLRFQLNCNSRSIFIYNFFVLRMLNIFRVKQYITKYENIKFHLKQTVDKLFDTHLILSSMR